MYQMAIIAFPQDAAKVMLVDDKIPATNNPSWMCWAPELPHQIKQIQEEYGDKISSSIIFGPKDYISQLVEQIKQVADIDIEIGDMNND